MLTKLISSLVIAGIMLSAIFILMALGPDNFSYQSVQFSNNGCIMLELFVRYLTQSLLVNVYPSSVSLYLVISFTYIVFTFCVPTYTCITVYPIKFALQCSSFAFNFYFLIIYSVSHSLAPIIIINILIFIITYFVMQQRFVNVIEHSIRWLILRRKHMLKIDMSEKFDIDYISIRPDWYIQILQIAIKCISMPIRIIRSVFTNQISINTRYQFAKIAKMMQIDIKIKRKYSQSIQIQKFMRKQHYIIDKLLNKDYMKQINKRLDFIERLNSQETGETLKLHYYSPLDYNIVAIFIAKQYVESQAHRLFQGQIQQVSQCEIIEIQYLKHLEFIVRARYPKNESVKNQYVTILAQMLNDITQAELQLKVQVEQQTTQSYTNQILSNQFILRALFGDLADEKIDNKENRKISWQEQRLSDRLSYLLKGSSLDSNYSILNSLWDQLDQQYLQLWSSNQEFIPQQSFEFYQSYQKFIETINDLKQLNNNQMVYDLFRFAMIRYYQLEEQDNQFAQQYQMFKNRYIEGQNIVLDNDDNYQIMDHYHPSTNSLRLMYQNDPQVIVLQNIGDQRVNTINSHVSGKQELFGPDKNQIVKAKIELLNSEELIKEIPLKNKKSMCILICHYVLFIIANAIIILAVIYLSQQKQYLNQPSIAKMNYITKMQDLLQYVQVTQQVNYSSQIQNNIKQSINFIVGEVSNSFDLIKDKQEPRAVPIEMEFNSHVLSTWEFVHNQLILAIQEAASQLPEVTYNTFKKIKSLAQPYLTEKLQQQEEGNDLNNFHIPLIFLLTIVPILIYGSRQYLISFISRDISVMYSILQQIPNQIKTRMSLYIQQISQNRKRFAAIRQGDAFQYLDMIITNKQTDADKNQQTINYTNDRYNLNIPKHNKKNILISLNLIIQTIIVIFVCALLVLSVQIGYEQSKYAQHQKEDEIIYFNQKKQILYLVNGITKTKYLQNYYLTKDKQYINYYQSLKQISIDEQYQSLIDMLHNSDDTAQLETVLQISKLFGYLKELENINEISLCIDQTPQSCNIEKLYQFVNTLQHLQNRVDSCEKIKILNELDNSTLLTPQKLLTNCYTNYLINDIWKRIRYIIYLLDRQATQLFINEDFSQFYLSLPIINSFANKFKIVSDSRSWLYLTQQNFVKPEYTNTIPWGSSIPDNFDNQYISDYLNSIFASDTSSDILNSLDWNKTYSFLDGVTVEMNKCVLTNYIIVTILILILILNTNKVNKHLIVIIILTFIGIIINVKIALKYNFNNKSIRSIYSAFSLIDKQLENEALLQNFVDNSYNETVLNQTLVKLYQYYSLYGLGSEQNCIQLSKIYENVDPEMHIMGYHMSLSFSEQLKQQLLDRFYLVFQQNSYSTNQDDFDNDNIDPFERVYMQIASYTQQNIKQLWQIIAYKIYAGNTKLVSDAMKNSKYYAPIKYILSYDQNVLKEQLDTGKTPTNTQMSPSVFTGMEVLNGLIYFKNQSQFYSTDLLNSYNLRIGVINTIYYSFIQIELNYDLEYNLLQQTISKSSNINLINFLYLGVLSLIIGLYIIKMLKFILQQYNFQSANITKDQNAIRFVNKKLKYQNMEQYFKIIQIVIVIGVLVLITSVHQINIQLINLNIQYKNQLLQLNNAFGAFGCTNKLNCFYTFSGQEYYDRNIKLSNKINIPVEDYISLLRNQIQFKQNTQNLTIIQNYVINYISKQLQNNLTIIPSETAQTGQSMYIPQLLSNLKLSNQSTEQLNSILYSNQQISLGQYDNITQFELILNRQQSLEIFIEQLDAKINYLDNQVSNIIKYLLIPFHCILIVIELMFLLSVHKLQKYIQFTMKTIRRIHRQEYDNLPPQLIINV
ncbi:Transmembrane_domain-containing protein [Hexamita inflata]|uniref:Transmembrane_domain-containing protein n=1 Tax=Hexamita inflata TaxID=28002 RepID=A0ABP1HYY6_9EUKA